MQSAMHQERSRLVLSGFTAPSAIPFNVHTASAGSLSEELHQLDVWTRRMNVEARTEAEWRRWEEASDALYAKIEGLPSTPQNARIKARAIWSIAGGDLDDVNEANSSIDRLVRQIIVGLLGDA